MIDVTPGACRAQTGKQRRQERVALQVVGGDDEGRAPTHQLEGLEIGETLEVAQDPARADRQSLGARGGDDAAARI